MTRTAVKLWTAAGAIVAVTVGIAFVQQWRDANRLRVEADRLRRATVELARLRAENQRLREQQRSLAARSAAVSERAAERVLATWSAGQRELDAVPVRSWGTVRLQVEERYAELLNRLRLPAERRERLIQLIAARYERLNGQAWAAARVGKSPNSPELLQSAHDENVRLGAQLRSEFGPRVAGEYRAFEWVLSARSVVTHAQRELAYSAPLTAEQQSHLFTVLLDRAALGFPGKAVYSYNLPPYSSYHIEVTEDVLRAAATKLSTEQLRALEKIRAGQRKPRD